eukprot:6180157-Pleurochrysis_carterae.AAC.1
MLMRSVIFPKEGAASAPPLPSQRLTRVRLPCASHGLCACAHVARTECSAEAAPGRWAISAGAACASFL